MINVNKFFRRLPIRVKLVIAFVLLGVIPLLVVGGYGAFYSFSLLSERLLNQVKFSVTTKAGEIQSFLSSVKENVLFLSRLPTFQRLIDLPDGAKAARQSLVEQLGGEFLAFSRAYRAYYQVRYIDQRGMEIVRADFNGKQSYLVPADQLQNKVDRYYFREAIQLPPGQVYVSPIDLNIEKGVVEVPEKPVVRYATPVINSHGENRGIVIINIYASYILGQVLALRWDEGGVVFLADKEGFYLSHSERSKANGGYFSLTAADNLKNDLPQLMAGEILSGKPGALAGPGVSGKIVAFAPIFPHVGNQREFWVIAQAYNKAEVLSSVRSFQLLILILGSLVLAIAITVGIAAAGHFTKPILELNRGAEIVAGGNFDHSIKVETNDELEDLSRQFNRMTGHLKEHQRQLLEARERAERKASEAEALNRIGMEVLSLLSLPEILQLVADKAREVLRGDLALLCLSEPEGSLRLGAVSGSVGALTLRPVDPLPTQVCGKMVCQETPCPAVAGEQFGSHVAVSMRSGERVVGNLCVASREWRSASHDEIGFLTGLANQATIAIEKARLHSRVKELAMLEEQERIARDLHDGIIQSIYATGLRLEECVRLAEGGPDEVKTRLEEVIEELNVVISDVRNYIVGLGPEGFQDHDLGEAVVDLARGLSHNGQPYFDLSVEPGIGDALTSEQASHLFHICREALSNVVKHALASRVGLTVRRQKGVLVLTVEDDGVGFDPKQDGVAGQGLRNMSERARRLGGSLSIESTPELGTRITLRAPLEKVA